MALQQVHTGTQAQQPTKNEQIEEELKKISSMINEMYGNSAMYLTHLKEERKDNLIALLNDCLGRLNYARKNLEIDYFKANYDDCLKG